MIWVGGDVVGGSVRWGMEEANSEEIYFGHGVYLVDCCALGVPQFWN